MLRKVGIDSYYKISSGLRQEINGICLGRTSRLDKRNNAVIPSTLSLHHYSLLVLFALNVRVADLASLD
jgi:hypothetical protein